MDNNGKLIVDDEEHFYCDAIDPATREKVYERMQKVNDVVGRIVERLMREETA